MNLALHPCKMGTTASPLPDGTVGAAEDGYEAVLTPRQAASLWLGRQSQPIAGPLLEAVQQHLEEATCLPTASLSRRSAAEALVTGECHSPTCSSPSSPQGLGAGLRPAGDGEDLLDCQRRGLPEGSATSCQQRGGGGVGRGGELNPEVYTMIFPESGGCSVSSCLFL